MIDREQVRKVALLARLNLTEAEEAQLTVQIGNILEYVEHLSELDVTGVEPTTRAIDASNVTRSDELRVYPDREALLAEAPQPEGDFFRVPQIMAPD
ncbi:Asp-tRNA(Asn)/Glu-tRNA(Gln) amidotransferase subunit GatC [Merismopedia glauca]|uniref:Aspartyl/glutamyl-tRNA(Asn/Gln) amidotransferase subunit C n=1 Tax=Merismopedia glauca CCAP 1448/3 TaxID=1296344 RepID=A0A2T1C5Z5_9CYAN|nr:Asp-tRNA(Asn)/Glu-tRNA(Gln) amidotransferase subunit GatC [Merismopedia glauca]PSB03553.1 Asp-tRNA(Asn)/Glu-tRNA(Gln) amidotransferase GatCAB subunit C [Merismopedia glauca CCAP 1448/3]